MLARHEMPRDNIHIHVVSSTLRWGEIKKQLKNNTHVSYVYVIDVLTTGLKTHGGGIKKFSEEANDYKVRLHVCYTHI